MGKISTKVGWEIIKKLFIPLGTFLLFVWGYFFYQKEIAPTISPELYESLKKYIGTIFIAWVAFTVQRIAGAVLGWYMENITARTKTKLDDKLAPILRRTLNVVIWIIALLVILPLYGVNINALIATLGVSSLAVALAAQDTIANIIAGFLIMVDTPFTIGDRIKLPSGEKVEVLDIGVRRSKFLSEDKAIVIVPNVDLSKSSIVNYTYGEVCAE